MVSVPPTPRRRSVTEQLVGTAKLATHREMIAKEVEDSLAYEHEKLVPDLVRAGGTIHAPAPRLAPPTISVEAPEEEPAPVDSSPVTPPPPAEDNTVLEEFWANRGGAATLARASYEPAYSNPFPVQSVPAPTTHLSPAARDVEVWVEKMKTKVRKNPPDFTKKKSKFSWFGKRTIGVVLAIFVVGGAGLTAVFYEAGGFVAKQNVLQNGTNAIANLEEAKKSLEEFNFSEAAERFALANNDFEKASGTLSNLGASVVSVFGNLPGLNKVKSANNLVQAGQSISKAGENLSLAFSNFYHINFFSYADFSGSTRNESLAKPLQDFQGALLDARGNIKHATTLLADIDPSSIPEDKRATLETFTKKIPDFEAYIDHAVEYSDFLLSFVGEQGTKTYLILLQNTTERRPTGGFPGTYAVVTFDRGTLKKVFVDDVYNPDGQIRANIIPPKPIQHITPNWGMRDANWFADFPTSAQKIEEMYLLDGGAKVDGVFTIDPTVIARILQVIGPIPMPEYGVTLDQNNFLAEIQDEVEYQADRAQPKKIVSDFQPKFFATLAEQDKAKWVEIMKVLVGSLEQKHIMAFFNDPKLQKEVIKGGFGGEVRDADQQDYVQVVFSNVKGSKSDAVTANAMRLGVDLGGSSLKHSLVITRAHNGGDSKYGFYNKDNPAYVKVYVPKGAVLEKIEGNTKTDYKPLVDYVNLGFKSDPELAALDALLIHPQEGVDVFEESGKTVFGFWMVVKPKKTISATVTYSVPADILGLDQSGYALQWQKQSGSDGDQMHLSAKIPGNATLTSHSPDAQLIGDTVTMDADLSIDRQVQFVYH